MSHIGEIAALIVAIAWTITALSFEYAAKRVGSLNVNLIRLPFGLLYLTLFTTFTREHVLPVDASVHQWGWLLASGLVGFVIGDLFLFKSFVIIGSRLSMLIMTLVPPITTIVSFLFLNETITLFHLFGMILTLSGIFITIYFHKSVEEDTIKNIQAKGILFAIGGAIGQALGLVLSKVGMNGYNAFASTQIRIIAGIFGFLVVALLMKRLKNLTQAIKNREGMKGILIGSFFGPFVGVSLSLFAIQHANTGVASTIMAIVPILIIAPSVFVFKQKTSIAEIIGAIISVCGVAMFFL